MREVLSEEWQQNMASSVSHHISMMTATICEYWTLPSTLFRPKLSIDGDQWCALYGDNLQEGVAGFGDTPAKAIQDFDKRWMHQKAAP